jgi:hypothetical protein
MLLTRCNPQEAEKLRKLIAGVRDDKRPSARAKPPKAKTKRTVQLVEQTMHFDRERNYWQLQLGLYLSREQYNAGGARWAKAATAKKHVDFTLLALRGVFRTFREDVVRERIRGVTLVRLSPNQLDDDNLQSAFKHVRDAVFAWIACGDSEVVRSKIGHYDATIKQGRHTCAYEQCKSEAHGIQIRLHV